MQAKIVLKRGKEQPILQHHHWIYSGAIQKLPEEETKGQLVPVFSSTGQKLGIAAYNPNRSIAAHMLAYGEEALEDALRKKIREAVALRKQWFDPQQTDAVRLINAEGDGIPGLIVDSYANYLVMQISHPALVPLQPFLQGCLVEEVNPLGIYEKSTSFLRKREGLDEVRVHHYGEKCANPVIKENGMRFAVDLEQGQKTGWFLDQRDTRALVRSLAKGRRVLNVFSYTGGFSVAALLGGATSVASVEISAKCQPLLEQSLALNELDLNQHRFVCEDAFDFLKKEPLDYDLIVLDPPAFAKGRSSVPAAFRAYKELNRMVFEKAPKGSILLSCSCSYHIEEELFQNILFRAALEANRSVRILSRHRQAIDHPVSLYHPESSYLKSFLLYLD